MSATSQVTVLSLPELLRHILSFVHGDLQDCLSCALVCKSWLSPSLDMLWCDVGNASRLFSRLSPMCPRQIFNAYSESDTEAWVSFSDIFQPLEKTEGVFNESINRNSLRSQPRMIGTVSPMRSHLACSNSRMSPRISNMKENFMINLTTRHG
jgi:hypothetical protein